ncbi:MAG: M15 family metallopeptidase [Candidatus Sungbacteria bacterium]|nr:M15 family metallopeptidase [Candidatus Sungbacteria bacterium]
MSEEKYKNMFEAVLAEGEKLALPREIQKHLAEVLLYEYPGADALHPAARPLMSALVAKSREYGTPVYVTSVFRSAEAQKNLYARGRSSAGAKVTNAAALESYHNYGLAFDVAFEGGLPYPEDDEYWDRIGEYGESLGLVWGGRFNDRPHFEYHPGFTWENLKPHFVV